MDIADLYACDVVITMLPDDNAAREVVFNRDALAVNGLALGLSTGAIHVSMSTISPAMSSEIAAEHRRCGQGYVAAPVFGNPDAAKLRQLYIVAAGAADDIERCRSIFELIGQRIFVAGSDPASANLIKLAANAMVGSAVEAMGEIFTLIRSRGIDPILFQEILTNSILGSRVQSIFGQKIASRNYATGGFVIPLALKDIRLVMAEADSAHVPMPSVDVVYRRMLAGIANGYSDFDWSVLGLIAEEAAWTTADAPKPAA
jgi:3-hydroxyisobutyrate dehydrogenase-like beta-hydroxyacid dehydrogenase